MCVSNVLSSPGVVEIYDSMPFYTTKSTDLHIQVAKIMKTKEKSFMLKYVDVQCQSGARECALLAIAYATALCTGSDPHLTNFIQEDLRAHLYKCFDSHLMLPFPAPDHQRRAGRQRIIHAKSVDVFAFVDFRGIGTTAKGGIGAMPDVQGMVP